MTIHSLAHVLQLRAVQAAGANITPLTAPQAVKELILGATLGFAGKQLASKPTGDDIEALYADAQLEHPEYLEHAQKMVRLSVDTGLPVPERFPVVRGLEARMVARPIVPACPLDEQIWVTWPYYAGRTDDGGPLFFDWIQAAEFVLHRLETRTVNVFFTEAPGAAPARAPDLVEQTFGAGEQDAAGGDDIEAIDARGQLDNDAAKN